MSQFETLFATRVLPKAEHEHGDGEKEDGHSG
jgi:hypothetical protein